MKTKIRALIRKLDGPWICILGLLALYAFAYWHVTTSPLP